MSASIGRRRFEVPRGIEAAARRLQAAAKADGMSGAIVHVEGDELASMWLFEKNGRQHFIMPFRGDWFEYFKLEEGD